MKKRTFLTVLLLAATTLFAPAQNSMTLQSALSNYMPEGMRNIVPMKDGETYTQLSNDGKKILRCSFKTGKVVSTLFDASTARGDAKIQSIDGYILSPDEKNILLQTKTQPVYRRTTIATYYIFSVENNKYVPLSENGPQQSPKFSPDGNYVAFVRQNNLFLVKLLFDNAESQITKDGKKGAIINGLPDWVYEEEFTTDRSFDFSADSKMLAWIRYDESKVKMFSFPLYKGSNPTREEYDEYPGTYDYKYPVAGSQNSKVCVLTYDIKSHAQRQIKLPMDSDGYIPRIQFTADPNKLAIVTLNRHQSRMDIYMANPRSTECKLALREESNTYVDEKTYTDLKFYPNHFAILSDRSGYRHLYWYTLSGQLVKQVTSGSYEVTDFYGCQEDEGRFYYAANAESPLNKAVYSTTLNGKTTKLSTQKGTNTAIFSANMKYFLNTYSSATVPPIITLRNNNGSELKTLVSNKSLAEKAAKDFGQKEFFTFKTSEGVTLNGWMIKPRNFDPNKKYPVIMYQYSGPSSQTVADSWYGIGFYPGGSLESYMAEQGFIMVAVDGRGTGGRGAEFQKCTYLTLGDKESKDQVEAALYLGTLPYVDKDNIGIWGWSFGGFNTLMSMSEGRPVFKAGVAVAAPTNWKFYDTVYTERYMRTPNENADGYAINPIERASKLHGDLLLIHGTADDNVHYRNAAEYSEALVQANKQFDMQVYTNRNHSIFGGNTRYHLFTRYANFFKTHLMK